MSNNQNLQQVPAKVDVAAQFGYPATSYVTVHQSDAGAVHTIYYAGAPSTLFDNAPNSSVLVDNTNGDTWVKTGAVGSGISGTWTQT